MISFGERCYSNQYDEFSDNEFSDDEISRFANTTLNLRFAKSLLNQTSRDRPKSAPYPRLINSKKTSKCQVFSFTIHENQKFFEKITYSKNGPSGALKSHNAEKLNGQFGVFQHPFCRKTSKN